MTRDQRKCASLLIIVKGGGGLQQDKIILFHITHSCTVSLSQYMYHSCGYGFLPHARIMWEGLMNHFLLVGCAEHFLSADQLVYTNSNFLDKNQSTVAQQAEMAVDKVSLTGCL